MLWLCTYHKTVVQIKINNFIFKKAIGYIYNQFTKIYAINALKRSNEKLWFYVPTNGLSTCKILRLYNNQSISYKRFRAFKLCIAGLAP